MLFFQLQLFSITFNKFFFQSKQSKIIDFGEKILTIISTFLCGVHWFYILFNITRWLGSWQSFKRLGMWLTWLCPASTSLKMSKFLGGYIKWSTLTYPSNSTCWSLSSGTWPSSILSCTLCLVISRLGRMQILTRRANKWTAMRIVVEMQNATISQSGTASFVNWVSTIAIIANPEQIRLYWCTIFWKTISLIIPVTQQCLRTPFLIMNLDPTTTASSLSPQQDLVFFSGEIRKITDLVKLAFWNQLIVLSAKKYFVHFYFFIFWCRY